MEAESGAHRTVEGAVITVLRDAIIAGVFAPGERLQQDRLACIERRLLGSDVDAHFLRCERRGRETK